MRLRVFKIWSILYSTFVVNWGHIFEPENLIQKRKPVIPENQLARGILSKIIRGLGVEPLVEGVGGEAPHKNRGLGEKDLP